MEMLEDRRVMDAGCRATPGLADNSEGTNLYGVMTPGGLLSYDSASARPSSNGIGSNRNGPLVTGNFSQAGGHSYDFVRYQTRALRDGTVLYTSGYMYSSVAQVAASEQIHLSEIVPNISVGTGTFDFEIIAEYFDESISPTVPRATETVSGRQTFEDRYNSPYGRGWKLQDAEYLLEESDGDVSWLGTRGEVWFDYTASPASYLTPGGIFGTLQKITDGTGTYFQFSEAWGSSQRYERAALTVGGFSNTKWLLVRSTDANGNSTQYTFDDKNADGVRDEIVTRTDPFGRSVTYAYANNLLQSMTDFVGRITSFAYDAGGLKNLVKMTSPTVQNELGASIQPEDTFAYTTGSMLSSVKDPLLHETTFTYGEGSRLTGRTNADLTGRSYEAMFARPLVAATSQSQFAFMPLVIKTSDLKTINTDERGHVTHVTTNRYCDEVTRNVEPQVDAIAGQIVSSVSYGKRPS
jgi:hypothetical protein